MAIFGAEDLVAGTNKLIVTMAQAATVNVLVSNANNGDAIITIWCVKGGVSAATKYKVIPPTLLGAGQPLEKGGIPLDIGDSVIVLSNVSNCNALVVGV